MPPINPVTLPVALFDHNWANNCSLESSWSTDSQDSISADETRRGLMDKPYRLQKRRGLTLARGQVGALLTQARKSTGGRFYSPIGCDVSYATQVTSAAGVTLFCDTTHRRFFVGYKVMVITFDRDKRASNIHVGTIASFTGTQIVLADAEPVPFEVPIGSHICPAMETEIDVAITANVITDTHVVFDMEEKERVGATALPALVAAESLPAGEPTYQGIPVFNIPHNWTSTEIGETRKSIQSSIGIDTVQEVYGASSVPFGLLSFQALNRSEAFRLLRFIDSRCGSLFSCWLPGHTADLEVISFSPFMVKKNIPAADILQRKFLCLRFDDAPQILRVTSAVDNGNGTITLTFAELLAVPAYNDLKMSFAFLAKFAADSFREDWQTDGTMAGQVRVMGLPVNSCNNGEVGDNGCDVPPDIDPPDPTDPIDPWVPFECSNPSVAVPMYEDVTAYAKNQTREAVRCADLNMPGQIQVKFKDGLVKDNSHEHAPALSEELMDQLIKDHALDYVGVMTGNSNAISRNPYHIRLGGSNPSDPSTWGWGMPALPGLAVNRHLWRKIINYSVGDDTFTIEIRFVAEWTEDLTTGMWGTIFYVVVFCNEINPSYSEGAAYAPHNGCTHFRNDPFVWGNYYFPGEPDRKLAHPQALLIATVATTWHSPMGYYWLAPENIRWKLCSAMPNGAPWSANDPEYNHFNTHFGQNVGVINMAAMTLGGAFPTSSFFEWMCIENAGAYGLTAMKPTRAGWNETVGDLTPELGNDISINVCNPGQALQSLNPCRGHPDEKFGGVGGSHKCWRSSDTAEYLCINTAGIPKTEVNEICKTVTTTHGPFNTGLGQCDPISQECSVQTPENKFDLVLWDYFLATPPAVSNTRFITFKGFYNDPEYVRQNWVFTDLGSLDLWVPDVGTWVRASSGGVSPHAVFTNTAVFAGNPLLKAYLRFDPEPVNLWKSGDGELKCKINNTTALAGAVCRWTSNGFGYQGYMMIWDNTLKTMTIYKVVNSVSSVLAVTTITDTVVDRDFTFGWNGTNIYMRTPRVTPLGEEEYWIVEKDDCTYRDDNEIGLVVINTVAGTVFSRVEFADTNWRKQETHIQANGLDRLEGQVDPKLCLLWGVCNITESCLVCNCTERTQTNISVYGGSSINTGTTVGLGMASPDDCNTVSACPPVLTCDSCPGPMVVFTIKLPTSCNDPDDPSTNPFQRGMNVWKWGNNTCV